MLSFALNELDSASIVDDYYFVGSTEKEKEKDIEGKSEPCEEETVENVS